jgi:undecaprenyl-diphosphatase
MSHVRLLINNCSGGYSFTSSHATNHFGLALFLFITLQSVFKKWRYLFLFWAATICYGQVYVGVHYPLDVLCGAILGSATGYITGTVFNKKIGLLNLDTL